MVIKWKVMLQNQTLICVDLILLLFYQSKFWVFTHWPSISGFVHRKVLYKWSPKHYHHFVTVQIAGEKQEMLKGRTSNEYRLWHVCLDQDAAAKILLVKKGINYSKCTRYFVAGACEVVNDTNTVCSNPRRRVFWFGNLVNYEPFCFVLRTHTTK